MKKVYSNAHKKIANHPAIPDIFVKHTSPLQSLHPCKTVAKTVKEYKTTNISIANKYIPTGLYFCT
jgi:hypothetical protein